MAEKEYRLRLKNAGRNDTCPCGSGKKYKKCHLQADEESYRKVLVKAREKAAAEAAKAEGEEPEEKREGQPHLPEAKSHKYAPKTPRPRPATGSRQVSTPRKAGTS